MQRWIDGLGCILAEEFVLFPSQDDRADVAGSLPKLGLPGPGDRHCGGEYSRTRRGWRERIGSEWDCHWEGWDGSS